jgi:LacI family transcriptional regulator
MATIKEVARRAGVSVGTVSNVLSKLPTVSPDLRKRVERAIAQMQYRPNQMARSLKKQTTQTLGLVISDITNPFFPGIVRGAEDEAATRGYMLSIFNTDDRGDKQARVLEMLEGRRVDGLILVPALGSQDFAPLRRLMEEGTPLVLVDREIDSPELQAFPVDSVLVDNRAGVQLGIGELLARGARRIAYIGGPPGLYISRERLFGYESALFQARLAKDPALIWAGDFREESGYLAVMENYLRHRPDAVFIANLLMSLGAARAFEELGVRIPEETQVVAFDHVPLLNSFHPRLSAIAQPMYEIGKEAVRTMLARLADRNAPARKVVLDAEWKEGETTRPRPS